MEATGSRFEDLDPAERKQSEHIRAKFWPKLARFAANVPFADELVAAYYCAFDRRTPHTVRITLLGALAYFVLPADAVPDFLPLVGFADDAGVLAAAVAAVTRHITPAHRRAATEALDRLRVDGSH